MINPQRDPLIALLRDMLAVQTAAQLGLVALPSEEKMNEIRRDAQVAAEGLLTAFEQHVLGDKVKEIVLRDVRAELLRRTRMSQYIEWALGISSFASAIIIGAGQFVFLPSMNVEAIKATYWVCLSLIVANFLGFLYLRYIDRG